MLKSLAPYACLLATAAALACFAARVADDGDVIQDAAPPAPMCVGESRNAVHGRDAVKDANRAHRPR